jgi:hypothetical protein
MFRRISVLLVTVLAGLGGAGRGEAQQYTYTAAHHLHRFYYYPYYYFPHNYWPVTSPRWPEQQGQPYMRPPAYMAYPPFLDPRWRYELWQPQRYYRGFHFWLDQF